MAQIRNDIKKTKRVFSGDTEVSHYDTSEEKGERSQSDSTTSPTTKVRGQKENLPEKDDTQRAVLSKLSASRRGKVKNSPRKRSRPLSVSDAMSRDKLADDMANLSMSSDRLLEQFPQPPVNVMVTIVSPAPSPVHSVPNSNPALLVPSNGEVPSYPSSSVRSGRNEDLTRFVSSSTTSGTTLTAGSAASFVKHPGPKQLRYIGPNDVPALPDRVGKMVFDKVSMKWVKDLGTNETPEKQAQDRLAAADAENDSEDPFRDIESLREEDSPGQQVTVDERDETHYSDSDEVPRDLEQSRIEELDTESEMEDMEEAELNSFSFDGPTSDSANIMDGQNDLDDTDTEDEHDEDLTATTGPSASQDYAVSEESDVPNDDANEMRYEVETVHQNVSFLSVNDHNQISTPQPPLRAVPPTPIIRSAMKSNSITPVSAMKDPSGSKNRTPANHVGHRRSVSFSDGKREGPIVGVGRNLPTPDIVVDDASPLSHGADRSSAVLVPSVRSKRIADMLEGLEDEGKCIVPKPRKIFGFAYRSFS